MANNRDHDVANPCIGSDMTQTPDIAADPPVEEDAYKRCLKQNLLRLVQEHRRFCPALMAKQPCEISFAMLRALLEMADIKLSDLERRELC
jgi:hypothetical protein